MAAGHHDVSSIAAEAVEGLHQAPDHLEATHVETALKEIVHALQTESEDIRRCQ